MHFYTCYNVDFEVGPRQNEYATVELRSTRFQNFKKPLYYTDKKKYGGTENGLYILPC